MPWEVECGWVRAESATQRGCAVRLTQQGPGAICARSPGTRAGEHPYILLSCVQSRSAAGHDTSSLSSTQHPFVVRRACNPGQGVRASRVYPLDVGRNGVPARVTINHTYIKSFLLQTYRHRITNIHRPAPFRPQLRKGAWTMNDRGRPYHRAHSRTW